MVKQPSERINELTAKIESMKKELAQLKREELGDIVPDYELDALDGSKVRLSELFGDKRDLIMVHNMGKRCTYCTMWADGFIGLAPHILDRTAFVLVSADDPETAREFSASRGWNYPVVSGKDSSFTRELGFYNETDGYWPGASTFYKNDDGTITRVSMTYFGPGDDFNPGWHFFDLLKDGDNDWQPKYVYPERAVAR
ncbi:MAG: DUF899 family protein [Fimbriimonadaceae bacterium]|nr:DUF899 family protein [Fimbriimonadaceae bacterium]